jgi:hypothetical protein
MQVSGTVVDVIRSFIAEASKSPLAAVVAFALLVSGLAYLYFGRGRPPKDGKLLKYRFAVFVLVFVFAVLGVWLIRSLPTGGALADLHAPRADKPQLLTEQHAQRSVRRMNPGDPVPQPQFGFQVRQARKYSGLTDYFRACEIYTAAFGSLPAGALSSSDREVVSVETRKCGNGRSQEAVEHLDGIATKLMVD